MAVISVEPVDDKASGLHYVAIYNPQDASEPFVTTKPRSMTAAAEENDVIAAIAASTNRGAWK